MAKPRGTMRPIPLYQPRAPRPRLLKTWARWALFMVIGIPALHYGIKLFFGMMPVTEKMLQGWGLLP